jgi:hypothetical protein
MWSDILLPYFEFIFNVLSTKLQKYIAILKTI